MLMVIFGAGASFDSAADPGRGDTTWQPPLGNQLFGPREYFGKAIDDFEEVRALATRLGTLPDGLSLEEELETLQEDAETYGRMRQQLTALRFYLQRVIRGTAQNWSNSLHGVTTYVSLVHTIDRLWVNRGKPVCFVTFNYDLLLDGALGQVEVFFRDLGSYVSNPDYTLIKPHGSVNWWHPIEGPIDNGLMTLEAYIIKNIDALKVSEDFDMGDDAGTSHRPRLPALSIPVARKTKFEFPETHRAALGDRLGAVTDLLVIGWKGNEEHFLDEMRKHLKTIPRTLVVTRNADSATAVGKKLQPVIGGMPRVSGSDFGGFLRRRELDEFLRVT